MVLSISQTMDSVVGYVVDIDNPPTVSLDSSIIGPISLNGGESTDFVLFYTATTPGEVTWQLRAIAPTIPDSSAITETRRVTVQVSPGDVTLQLINSIPTAVTKGQTNIFPLSLRFSHPDTLSTVASLRLTSLVISIEDGFENSLVASEAFSRIALASGYTTLAVVDTVPNQSSITMVFSEPVIVSPGAEQTLSLVVDIDSLATAGSFAVSLGAATAIPLIDDNTQQPIVISSGVTFPLRTESCRIDIPSHEAAVSYSSLLQGTVNYGQEDVDILQLNLRHPGSAGSSQIQLTGLTVQFLDEFGSAVIVSQLFEQIWLARQNTIVGQVTGSTIDTSMVTIQLGSPLTLSAGEQDSLRIVATIRESSAIAGFSLLISDSTKLVVRDLGSGLSLTAVTDTVLLSTGTAFPMATGVASLKQPALAPGVCVASLLPTSIVGGADSVALIEYTLVYPVSASRSSIRVNSSSLHVLDSLGNPLEPGRLFDRIGFRLGEGPVSYQSFVQLLNGAVVVNFGDTGLLVDPGDSLVLKLVADFEADAPFDHFVLLAGAEDALSVIDATDPSYYPGFSTTFDCSAEFPLVTEATQIFLPAGRPGIQAQSLPVQVAFPGQTGMTIFEASFLYESPALQGDLSISSVCGQVLKRTATGLTPVPAGLVFEAVHLFLNDQLVASDSGLDGDSVIISLVDDFVLSSGSGISVQLRCDLGSNPQLGNYVIRFADSLFVDIIDRNLSNPVYPILAGQVYPLWSAEISVSAPNLENSFSNYPNPFNPSRGEGTRIAYVLAEAAHVDIEVFSITGKAVKQVAMNLFREATSHQSDVWSGVNDVGRQVAPGAYFCRITARYASGRVESFRRKIAVIR